MKWNLFDKKWINKPRENYLILFDLYDSTQARLAAFEKTCVCKRSVWEEAQAW